MKIITIILVVLMTSISYADVIVIYDSATNDILTVSEKDDTIVPDGYKKVVLDGKIKNLGLSKNPVDYKYIDGDFILNNDKINADDKVKKDKEDKDSDISDLNNYILNKFCIEMEASGTNFKNIKCTDFE